MKKTLISTVLLLLLSSSWLFIFEEWCKCTFKNKKNLKTLKHFFGLPSWRSLTKKAEAGSRAGRQWMVRIRMRILGSVPKCHGSGTLWKFSKKQTETIYLYFYFNSAVWKFQKVMTDLIVKSLTKIYISLPSPFTNFSDNGGKWGSSCCPSCSRQANIKIASLLSL